MKRFFTVALIALLSCTVVYAQLDSQHRSGSDDKNKVDNTDKGKIGGKGGKGKDKVDDGTYKSNVLQFVVEGVPFEMVEVRGGTFTMGASSASESWGDDRPTHKVTVDDYYIGETTVTQGFWQAIMGTTLTDFASQLGVCTYGVGDDYPMYFISWDDCEEFIGKLNEITQMNFRLPTEAEWEFACRGGKNSKKYKYSGSNDIDEVAWYSDNSNASTQPVATKAPNELGIYDMSGNVWEWCSDWFGFYTRDSQDNPTGPASGDDRVMRGAGFSSYADETLLHTRYYGNPAKCYNNFGFRLALTYPGKRLKR